MTFSKYYIVKKLYSVLELLNLTIR